MKIDYEIGDCREVMKELPDDSFDSCVTDAPYELEFMGKDWDKQGVAYDPDVWREVFRLLKPGAYLLNCGGTRTYDLMVGAVRKADFEIRDMIPWIYGSGFPKSMDISKQIDKYNRKLFVSLDELQDRLNAKRIEKGLTLREINKLFGVPENSGCAAHKFCDKSQPQFPTREQMAILDETLELNGELWELYDEVEREVIGQKKAGLGSGETYAFTELNPQAPNEVDITVPATADAKKWSGYGTALKPAVEPIVVARKPISEKNVAMNVLTHGVGGINVDGCRIGYQGEVPNVGGRPNHGRGEGYGFKPLGDVAEPNLQGRFPANIILECTCEKVIPGKVGNPKVASGTKKMPLWAETKGMQTPGRTNIGIRDFGDTAPIHTNPNCPCYVLDGQSGESKSTPHPHDHRNETIIYGGGKGLGIRKGDSLFADKGGASRFFYVAKASRRERWFYCSVCNKAYSGDKREAHKKHSMHCLDCGVDYEPVTQYDDKRGIGNFPNEQFWGGGVGRTYQVEHRDCATKSNLLFHVTQKPEQLMRYLIRLVTPPGGTVLDPFVGSGTTLVAARMEGMNATGIEIGTEYEPLIKGRLNALPRALEEFHQPTTTPSPNESKKYAQETE